MPGRRACVCAFTLVVAGCASSAAHTAPPNVAGASTSTAASTAPPRDTAPGAAPSPSQRTEPPLPVALQEGGAAVAGNVLYEVAGYDTNRLSSNDVFAFDGKAWHQAPSLPVALNHPGVASIGTDVYVAGGFTPRGATNRVFVLHRGAQSWSEVAAMRRPRGALSLLALQGKLYAFGGRNGAVEVAAPEQYDPARDAWSDLPPMPAPRNHGAGYVRGASACIAGGRTPATSAAIDCFDTETSSWGSAGALPVATSGASAAYLDGIVLVAGGEPSTETNLVPVVQEQRGAQWTSQPMLVPRHGAASAIYNGRLWQCGGATAPGFHAVATCTSTG